MATFLAMIALALAGRGCWRDELEVEEVIARVAGFAAEIDFERNFDLSHSADLDDGEAEEEEDEGDEVEEGESVIEVL